MRVFTQKSDTFGAMASALCLVHCIATPFIFIAQTCSLACCSAAPTWWRYIDYFFVIVSFFAIYQSIKTTTSTIIKPALWISWLALVGVLVNESMLWFNLGNMAKYIPALALITLHLYNLKYCQCQKDTCCASQS